ncbi:MAG: IgGFc-binding protein, partial [Tannerella sp.]|nr:IgGFc-binding protein [Tannerella sp.]
MKKLLFSILITALSISAFAQDSEYWFAAPDVASTHVGDPVFFMVSNPDTINSITVTIDLYAGSTPNPARTFTSSIPAGGTWQKWLGSGYPDALSWVENPYGSAGTTTNYGIHIYASGPTPNALFLAYYMVTNVPGTSSQKDLFSLKGKPALGTKFYTPFMEKSDNYFLHTTYASITGEQIDIVATENNTQVTISAPRSYVGGTLSGGKYTSTHTLNRGQTLKIAEPIDGNQNTGGNLAGTLVTSTKPIAVTIAEDCVWNAGAGDLIGDQIIPVELTGTKYVVVAGEAKTASNSAYLPQNPSVPISPANYNNRGERIDFVATQNNTQIHVYGAGGVELTSALVPSPSPVLNAGDTWHFLIPMGTTVNTGVTPDTTVFVHAVDASSGDGAPVYCFHRSAVGQEMGGACLPSFYSISQKKIDFYLDIQTVGNFMFVVFKAGSENDFDFVYNGIHHNTSLASYARPVPAPAGMADDWRWAKVNLSAAPFSIPDYTTLSVRNSTSPFSLGYFNGNTGTAGYGYLTGFGRMSLPFDTLWSCISAPRGDQTTSAPGSQPACAGDLTIRTGVAVADLWKWYKDDDATPFITATFDTLVNLTQQGPGMYWVDVDQDGYHLIDTVYMMDMIYDASLKPRIPAKPAKVTVPNVFEVDYGPGRQLPEDMHWEWLVDPDATITSQDSLHAKVVWSTTGNKQIMLHLWATGDGCLDDADWDTDPSTLFLQKTCDTLLVYDILVHEKNLGFFVDQNVPYENEHNGTSWSNAFPTIQQALALASQGDYIWVADGTYSPHDSLPAGA